MSPVYEAPKSKSPWWLYIIYGCGGCAVLFFVGLFAAGFFMASGITKAITSGPSISPSTTTPYRFGYAKTAAKCRVDLPNRLGSFTYMHVLVGTLGAVRDRERSLTLTTSRFKNRELPLEYYAPADVRIGVYIYPAAMGGQNYVRLHGSGGESLIDLDRGMSMLMTRQGKSIFAGDFYNPYVYSTGGEDAAGNLLINGKPALNVTSILAGKGNYLGSIVRDGNSLKFVKAP